MFGMNRIKKIIEALRILSNTPSKTIRNAVVRVMVDATKGVDASEEDRNLVANILSAVVTIAEDMEKPSKKADEVQA